MLDPAALALVVGALLGALVLMERVAARALRSRNGKWHQHYQRLPENASVVAEFAWRGRAWITAFTDAPFPGAKPVLRFISLAPMHERDRAACFRWLEAEGFDRVGTSAADREQESFERPFPA